VAHHAAAEGVRFRHQRPHLLEREGRVGRPVARPGARAAGGSGLDHVGAGGSDAEQTRDGDWLDHHTRYRRTDEYLHVLRRMWTSAEPFDHEGEFYRFAGAFSEVKPLQPGGIPLYFGGASGPAATVAAKHCDVYALWGEPLAAVKQRMADIHDKTAAFGRRPRASASRCARYRSHGSPGVGSRAAHPRRGDGRHSSPLSRRRLAAPGGAGVVRRPCRAGQRLCRERALPGGRAHPTNRRAARSAIW
jgi:hypothetical protein